MMRAVKTIQQIRGKNRSHASRFMRPAPNKLAELMKLHNAIYGSPKERKAHQLKPLDEGRKLSKAVWWYQADAEALKHCLNNAPKIIRDYVYAKSGRVYFEPSTDREDISRIERAAARYEDLRKSLEHLSYFASCNTDYPRTSDKQITRSISGEIRIVRDEEGLVGLIKDTFTEAVEGAEFDRIRECLNKNCNKVFYAGRLTIKCCSTSCAHAYRNQKSREKYREDPSGYVLKQAQRERKKRKGTSGKKRKGE
jgi:hypothetical protein